MYSDSGVVDITQHLEYITLGCNLVDREKNTDRYGQKSDVIATLPIDTTQNLNGSFTHYKRKVQKRKGWTFPLPKSETVTTLHTPS